MNVHTLLESQYHASLAMLRNAIAACPDHLWNDAAYTNRFWRIAYHALFYTHLYLSPTEGDFVPFTCTIPNAHFLDALLEPIAGGDPMSSREELLAYADHVMDMVGNILPSDNLEGPSGFDWVPLSRMETHVYNIRHTQHHVGQLTDRLRSVGDQGLAWVGRKK